jgi:hypothetical protein
MFSDAAEGVAVSGIYAYVAAGDAGLQVVDIRDKYHPRRIGGNTGFPANSVSISSNRLYVAGGSQGLMILPLLTPIQFSNTVSVITNTYHLWVNGPTGQVVRIQRTTNVGVTNLWVDWKSLTFSNANYVELVDTNYPSNPRRFYRGISP